MEVKDMDFSHRTIARVLAIPLALSLAAAAHADDKHDKKHSTTAGHSDAVEMLKSRLGPAAASLEVDDIQVASSGASCITYSVNNSTGGETHAKAVVQGDKVLRSTSRTNDFEDAWNTHCVGNRSASN
jgi:hypothetical protein